MNELLVDKLANNKVFQQFAIRTDAALKNSEFGKVLSNPAEALKKATDLATEIKDKATREAMNAAREIEKTSKK